MTFSECDTGVTGQANADRLLSHLDAWRLPASHVIGQSYDGARAIAGKNKGAAACITEVYPRLPIPTVLLMPSTCVL